MADKKELNFEDLDKVTGGASTGDDVLPAHGQQINGLDYKNYYDQTCLVVNKKNNSEWARCKLKGYYQMSGSSGFSCAFYVIETNLDKTYDFAFTGKVKAGWKFTVGDTEVDIYLD